MFLSLSWESRSSLDSQYCMLFSWEKWRLECSETTDSSQCQPFGDKESPLRRPVRFGSCSFGDVISQPSKSFLLCLTLGRLITGPMEKSSHGFYLKNMGRNWSKYNSSEAPQSWLRAAPLFAYWLSPRRDLLGASCVPMEQVEALSSLFRCELIAGKSSLSTEFECISMWSCQVVLIDSRDAS